MTSSPAPACNSCRIDLFRTGAIRMKKCKHGDSRTRVGWAVCSDGDDAVIQEGGGRCGWHFLYVWTSILDQGQALPFPWIWDNGVLDTALLMSWILIHTGLHLLPTWTTCKNDRLQNTKGWALSTRKQCYYANKRFTLWRSDIWMLWAEEMRSGNYESVFSTEILGHGVRVNKLSLY